MRERKKYDALAGVNIVGALPSISTSIALTELNQGSGSNTSTYTASIPLNFSCGSKYTSTNTGALVNLYTYYNEQDYGDPLAKNAKDTLSQLKDLEGYTGLKFEFTVSVAA